VWAVTGLPGSGKSTLAKRIAEEREAVRFSADAWVIELYGPDLPVEDFGKYKARVWELAWRIAEQVLRRGVDVVLDFSFYAKAERREFRVRAARAGADFRILYLRCPRDVLLRRLEARRRALPPNTFDIDEAQFARLCDEFEAPADDEADGIEVVHAEEDELY